MQNKNEAKTVVVGMSGGVDSSVTALLLKQQGYNVIGVHMVDSNADAEKIDVQSVRDVCDKLGITYEIVNYQDQMQKVKDYFIQEYASGRTPNPCVMCNKTIKFKPFIDYANKVGADYFATGHYANVEHLASGHVLKKGDDPQKDQSYFLNQLSSKQLEKAIFPLGHLNKSEVRKIAEENGLVSANKKDSFDVCFIDTKNFKDYMNKNWPEKAGDIVDVKTNKIVGKHDGISKFTIGQRKGLGIGGGHGESGECWFVVKKDIDKNILFVAQGNDDVLYSDALVSNNFNWIAEPKEKNFECVAKFRYRQSDQDVSVKILDNGEVEIEFAKPQRAVTIGQYAVLYSKDERGENTILLGGGAIDKVIKKR